ncbi:nicotinate-nicotinamide nucleotide adenylyltransferase [Candidatus Saccharibacteria bacterium]|nr:nicotinate-nicotinamide nucleotide adenylyltransferase [Candidatus Saccharibacteria bacterium]
MKNVILYGGAFNPPTNAHKAILEACITYATEVDGEVWVMPSGNRFDKAIPTPIDKRLSLIEAFIQSVNSGSTRVKIEDFELRSSRRTQTFETYTVLQRMYPEIRQTWVFGSDSILTMKRWENGERLFDELKMIVIERAGSVVVDMPPNAQVIPVDTQEVSSTMVREHISEALDFSHLVPPEVHQLLT